MYGGSPIKVPSTAAGNLHWKDTVYCHPIVFWQCYLPPFSCKRPVCAVRYDMTRLERHLESGVRFPLLAHKSIGFSNIVVHQKCLLATLNFWPYPRSIACRFLRRCLHHHVSSLSMAPICSSTLISSILTRRSSQMTWDPGRSEFFF